jgi:spore coat polysaccharide biosynthesis predicted glycosyltransferase SpsG
MILIAARGGALYGIGNLSRAHTLLRGLLSLGLKDSVYALFEADCAAVLEKYKSSPNISFSVSSAETADFLRKSLADLLICDLPYLTDEEAALIDKFSKVISLSDACLTRLKPDALICADPFPQSFPSSIEVYGGLKYFMVRQEILAKRPKHFIPVKSVSNVLIVFGGADPGCFYEYIIDKLPPPLNWTLVLGSAVDKERRKALSQRTAFNLNILEDGDIPELIERCDLCVSLGGLTAFEALCLGKPSAAVEYRHLTEYVRKLDECGLLCNLGGIEDFPSTLLRLIKDNEKLNRTALNGYLSIDGRGVSRAAEAVIEIYRSCGV